MFKVNDVVNYSTTGACKIVEIQTKQIANNTMDYYVLKPIFRQNSTVYVPLGNQALLNKMRNIIPKKNVEHLISQIPSFEDCWIDNDIERNKTFREILHSGDFEKTIKLLKTLYCRKRDLEAVGKHLRAADAVILRDAGNVVHSEIAYTLDIEFDGVESFIKEKIKK